MPGATLKTDFWLAEYSSPHDIYYHGVVKVLCYRKTPYQEMYIVDGGINGKALVLDGKWQSCQGDEFLYHEALVHPACVFQGRPGRVLILGGGEGATAREVLKWASVERVVMVDIDREVVEACREHLPEIHQGAFDDPRLEVIYSDAYDYLTNLQERWDVIISDLSDPIEEGPAFPLFTREFFQQCAGVLEEQGWLVVQAGPTAPPDMDLHARLVNTLRAVFPHVLSYSTHVPTFASPWGFALAGRRPVSPRIEPSQVDEVLAREVRGPLRMFDGITLLGMLHPPKHIRDLIRQERRIFTLEDPPSYFGSGSMQRP